MKTKFFIMTILLLLIPIVSFGMVQEVPNVDLTDPSVLIGLATAGLTLAATWAVKKAMPVIKGIGTIVAATIIAGVITLISNWLNISDIGWGWQLLGGVASVFFHQVYTQIKALPMFGGPA